MSGHIGTSPLRRSVTWAQSQTAAAGPSRLGSRGPSRGTTPMRFHASTSATRDFYTNRRPFYPSSLTRAHSTSASPSAPLSSPPTPPSGGFSTINASEISHFSRLSSEWWSETGEFALLHRMNPARISYIRQIVAFDDRFELPWSFADRASVAEREKARGTGRWLAGKRCLDVGCGGGLLSESLARLGGDVVGVDASGANVKMARLHASEDEGLGFVQDLEGRILSESQGDGNGRGRLEYRHTSAEALRDAGEKFDVVCAMEVVEHVDQPAEFMKALGEMVKPGGYLIMSTISRTPLAKLLTITLAEHALRLVTPGTHTYSKYITPSELTRFVYTDMGGFDTWERQQDGSDARSEQERGVGHTQGIVYIPWKGKWELMTGTEGSWGKWAGEGCNYMFGAKKRVDAV